MRPWTSFLFLALAVLVAACAPGASTRAPSTPIPASAVSGPGFPARVTDDAGRQVVVAAPPGRIISIAPSNTEILFALGLDDRVVAVDQYSNYPATASRKPQLGSYVKPDLEQIVAASPDLVLATAVHAKTVVPALEDRGITVFVVDAKNLDEVFNRIRRVGRITGQDVQAATLVGALRDRADAVATGVAGARRPRVFFELSPQLHTAGPGSFVDDLIGRAGGQNIAGDAATQWPQISQEALVQKDPEVVLLAYDATGVTPETALVRPGWGRLSAVQQRRVRAIDPDLTTRPGPRVVDGLEAIARALHPDRFG